MSERPASKLPRWLIILAAMIVPASGHVLIGKPMRGLTLLFFMGFFAVITFQLTGEDISPVGRLSGGFAVWALSVIEIYSFTRR
ncbi:MAG: hypothetical protein M0021_16350 [Clostridia bacterium]|nr:hypothetical protein [Clostridia bacterium]